MLSGDPASDGPGAELLDYVGHVVSGELLNRGTCFFLRRHGKLATITAARPSARYGHLDVEERPVDQLHRKPADH